jgi:hypothetical protein
MDQNLPDRVRLDGIVTVVRYMPKHNIKPTRQAWQQMKWNALHIGKQGINLVARQLYDCYNIHG